MYKEGLSAASSVAAAQALRPIINPIGQLPLLLVRFEALRDVLHERTWAEAEAARLEQAKRDPDLVARLVRETKDSTGRDLGARMRREATLAASDGGTGEGPET